MRTSKTIDRLTGRITGAGIVPETFEEQRVLALLMWGLRTPGSQITVSSPEGDTASFGMQEKEDE